MFLVIYKSGLIYETFLTLLTLMYHLILMYFQDVQVQKGAIIKTLFA